MIKQKIIRAENSSQFKQDLDAALSFGWLVHQMIVNSETGWWMAVVYMEVKQ